MDRYTLFRQLMDLLADEGEIVDADMCNWDDALEITAVCGDHQIVVNAKIKEEKKDGN